MELKSELYVQMEQKQSLKTKITPSKLLLTNNHYFKITFLFAKNAKKNKKDKS